MNTFKDDQTLCMRKHADGSLTLIDLHGVVVGHLTKEQLCGRPTTPESVEEEFGFFRGFMWAAIFSSLFWGTLLWLMMR